MTLFLRAAILRLRYLLILPLFSSSISISIVKFSSIFTSFISSLSVFDVLFGFLCSCPKAIILGIVLFLSFSACRLTSHDPSSLSEVGNEHIWLCFLLIYSTSSQFLDSYDVMLYCSPGSHCRPPRPPQSSASLLPQFRCRRAAMRARSAVASSSIAYYCGYLNVWLRKFREEILTPKLQFLRVSS